MLEVVQISPANTAYIV